MENLKLETEIQQELNCMTLRSLASVDLTVPSINQKNAVQEFFLLMAICNTVVVSLHAHEDPVSLKYTKYMSLLARKFAYILLVMIILGFYVQPTA